MDRVMGSDMVRDSSVVVICNRADKVAGTGKARSGNPSGGFLPASGLRSSLGQTNIARAGSRHEQARRRRRVSGPATRRCFGESRPQGHRVGEWQDGYCMVSPLSSLLGEQGVGSRGELPSAWRVFLRCCCPCRGGRPKQQAAAARTVRAPTRTVRFAHRAAASRAHSQIAVCNVRLHVKARGLVLLASASRTLHSPKSKCKFSSKQLMEPWFNKVEEGKFKNQEVSATPKKPETKERKRPSKGHARLVCVSVSEYLSSSDPTTSQQEK